MEKTTFRAKKRKGYFRQVQRIMEFYMSDANLRRDKYLKSRLDDQMEIKSTAFLHFNRIRALKATVHDIMIALKPSRSLEATNFTVKRRFPIQEKSKEDVDKSSIYVERLPPDISPEFLAQVFSSFGKVNLVTIPRYQSNKKVKGYGFIEFEEEASCAAALEKFSSFGGVLGEYCSSCSQCRGAETEGNETENEAAKAPETDAPPVEEPSKEENPVESVKTVAENHETKNEKRRRRRRRKRWLKAANYAHYGLQIMSKDAWNQLRHRYLCIQAANRRYLKAQLAKVRKVPTRLEKIKALIPETIVAISRTTPITESEAIALKLADFLEYVDFEVGSMNGFIRMANPESATWLLQHASELLPSFKLEALSPEDERNYWKKIESDREKLKSRKPRTNVSGVQKILKRAEKHFANR